MAVSALERLYSRHLVESGYVRQLGKHAHIRVRIFLDLMSASHVPADLDIMAEAMASYIRSTWKPAERGGFCVAGPKRGNSLLIRAVASRLGVPSVFVKDSALFNEWLEGVVQPSVPAILVDDIASDGELLSHVAERLTESGHVIAAAFVLVNRREGDCVRHLAKNRITLHSHSTWDDSAFRDLKARVQWGAGAE